MVISHFIIDNFVGQILLVKRWGPQCDLAIVLVGFMSPLVIRGSPRLSTVTLLLVC